MKTFWIVCWLTALTIWLLIVGIRGVVDHSRLEALSGVVQGIEREMGEGVTEP